MIPASFVEAGIFCVLRFGPILVPGSRLMAYRSKSVSAPDVSIVFFVAGSCRKDRGDLAAAPGGLVLLLAGPMPLSGNPPALNRH